MEVSPRRALEYGQVRCASSMMYWSQSGGNAGEFRMQFHRQTVASLKIFNQAHQCPHCGILERSAQFFGHVVQGTVVTGEIRARKEQLGIVTALLGTFLQRISQSDFEQLVRCLDGS